MSRNSIIYISTPSNSEIRASTSAKICSVDFEFDFTCLPAKKTLAAFDFARERLSACTAIFARLFLCGCLKVTS